MDANSCLLIVAIPPYSAGSEVRGAIIADHGLIDRAVPNDMRGPRIFSNDGDAVGAQHVEGTRDTVHTRRNPEGLELRDRGRNRRLQRLSVVRNAVSHCAEVGLRVEP